MAQRNTRHGLGLGYVVERYPEFHGENMFGHATKGAKHVGDIKPSNGVDNKPEPSASLCSGRP